MTSFTNHDGRIITAETATKAQLRYMLEDEAAHSHRLWDELEQARRDIQNLMGFCAQIAPHVTLPNAE